MKANHLISTLIFLTVILYSFAAAQTQTGDVKTYDKDGLSFNYPAAWELTDQSTTEMQQLKLTLPKNFALIYVTSPRNPISTEEQLITTRESITDQFIENITQKFTPSPTSLLKPETVCTTVSGKTYGATVIRGTYQSQLTTADILPTFPEHRFVNLVFIRSNKDYEQAIPAWLTITKTIKTITPKAENLPVPSIGVIIPAGGGTLNGRAISLPRPRFPLIASQKRIEGAVSVKVTLDETGKVIAARATSGATELAGAAVEAAKKSSFSPTYLCGEPVKVVGIIIYNFVR